MYKLTILYILWRSLLLHNARILFEQATKCMKASRSFYIAKMFVAILSLVKEIHQEILPCR